jgi:hypothetical protein
MMKERSYYYILMYSCCYQVGCQSFAGEWTTWRNFHNDLWIWSYHWGVFYQ